jgi:hypothetical protein
MSVERTTSATTSCRASEKHVVITPDNFARGIPSLAGFSYRYERNEGTYVCIAL